MAFVALPTKLTVLPSQIVWFKPALTTWSGTIFNIIDSETLPVQGATDWAVRVSVIGVPAIISAALGV